MRLWQLLMIKHVQYERVQSQKCQLEHWGAGIGGIGSFAALYGLGTVGLSAVGITSGLATIGSVVGGGMVAGVFVMAAPND